MPRPKRIVPADLTVAQLKHLLVAKEQIAPLQEKKAELEKELAAVDKQLAQLAGGAKPAARRGRKPGRKPGRLATKKPERPVAKKAGKRVAKKAARRVVKKAGRRVAKKAKAAPRKQARANRAAPTIESVIVQVIRQNRKPMAFQDLLATIKKGKLVETKSKNFANVLRRVLSTSTAVKRVARATYGV